MDKLIVEIFRHVRAMWRYHWLGLMTAWTIAVICAVVVFAIPKKYEATARVYVNTDSILKPLMAGMTVQPDNGERVALLSKLVISRPNVDQFIREAGLDAKVKTPEQRERLIDNVMGVLDIEGSGDRDNIYRIKFRDTKPERAQRMVELLVSKFVNSSKGGGTNDSVAAKDFLDEQAASYEKKLQEAESRLKEFKLSNMTGMVAGEGADYVTQLSSVNDQLRQAQLQLREAETSRDAFRRGLMGDETSVGATPKTSPTGETVAELDARIDSMQRNLDSLLQRYTESHPDVAGARRVISELKEQRRRLAAEYHKAGIPLTQVSPDGARAAEQLKVSLTQAEASAASLRARVAEYTTRYNQLRETARRMPEYEAQLAQLNRDYQVNKKNYEDLITRRESASIASDMQSVSGVADFRLIDPPRVSPNSISPSRSLMLAATLILALSAGLGIMFLAKEIRASFYDRAQLGEMLGLPILGVISIVADEKIRIQKRKNYIRLTQTAVLLFGIYATVVVAGLLLTKPTI